MFSDLPRLCRFDASVDVTEAHLPAQEILFLVGDGRARSQVGFFWGVIAKRRSD
jgi:hypothetical protein